MDDKCIVCQNRPLCKKAKSTCHNDENFVINWDYVTYFNMGFYPLVNKEKVNEFIFKVMNEEQRKMDYEKYVLGKLYILGKEVKPSGDSTQDCTV